MREIKLRGKVKYNGNHYFSGDWVYGFYFIDEQDNHYIIDSTPDEFGNARFAHVQVVPETVGQYTGLEDSTGKEIYEGDIAQVYSGKDSMFAEKANVIFYANGWCVDASPYYPRCRTGWCVGIHSEMSIEIIGNIHEVKK